MPCGNKAVFVERSRKGSYRGPLGTLNPLTKTGGRRHAYTDGTLGKPGKGKADSSAAIQEIGMVPQTLVGAEGYGTEVRASLNT